MILGLIIFLVVLQPKNDNFICKTKSKYNPDCNFAFFNADFKAFNPVYIQRFDDFAQYVCRKRDKTAANFNIL